MCVGSQAFKEAGLGGKAGGGLASGLRNFDNVFLLTLYFILKIFLMWTIFKVFIEFVTILLLVFFFLIFIYLFIYLFIYWLCWVFVAARGLSLVVVSGGYSSSRWLLLLRSMDSRRAGFSSCGTQAQ